MENTVIKIKLNLAEMFALSQIIKFQEIIGYQTALTKIYHEMLNVEEFGQLIATHEEIQQTARKISMKYASQRKDSTDPHDSEEINKAVLQEMGESNKKLIHDMFILLTNEDEILEYDFDPLLISAIKCITESNKSIEDLKMSDFITKSLINVHMKIDQFSSNNSSS